MQYFTTAQYYETDSMFNVICIQNKLQHFTTAQYYETGFDV